MNIPSNLKYTKSHEWVRVEGDGTITVGITDHAQELLGDLVFVELPEVGKEFAAEQEAAVVESVKAVSDIFAPVNGTVVEINETLNDAPEKVNQDPYGQGWIAVLELTDVAGLNELMDSDAYAAQVAKGGH